MIDDLIEENQELHVTIAELRAQKLTVQRIESLVSLVRAAVLAEIAAEFSPCERLKGRDVLERLRALEAATPPPR